MSRHQGLSAARAAKRPGTLPCSGEKTSCPSQLRLTAPAPPPPSANGKRYLLVLDMDLLAVDEQLGLEPINYLVARQAQEPCEVVVLSLVSTRQARMPSMELLLGATRGVFPRAPRPRY